MLLIICILLVFCSVNGFVGIVGPRERFAPLFMARWSNTKPMDAAPPPIINELIKAHKVRLLIPADDDEYGEKMIGVFPIEEALQKAKEMELDLVLINEGADPPVCKIIDYGKHKYSIEKKKKESAKRQVRSDVKEVKLSYKIDQHDFDVRQRAVQRFIEDGDRVKVILQFKGREMQHAALGHGVMAKMFEPLQLVAVMEAPPKVEGRSMMMILGPKKNK